MKRITIIGVGKVGSALAIELSDKGFKITALVDRNISRIKRIKPKCGCEYVMPHLNAEVIGKSDVLILCLKDDDINKYVLELHNINLKGKILLHTSGLLTSEVFNVLNAGKSHTGSFHPAQTFTKQSFANKGLLSGIYFGVEGGKYALEFVKEAVKKFKSDYIVIPKNQKPLYHLSCVVSSNFLIANFYLLKIFSKSLGIKEHKLQKILEPLFCNTLKNIHEAGVTDSLTGPVSRGDISTVNSHLNLLHRKFPKYVEYYKVTSKVLAEVARFKSNDIKLNKILGILKNE